MPQIKSVYYQSDRDVALIAATRLIEEYSETYPSAIKCFQDDVESCLNFIKQLHSHFQIILQGNKDLTVCPICGKLFKFQKIQSILLVRVSVGTSQRSSFSGKNTVSIMALSGRACVIFRKVPPKPETPSSTNFSQKTIARTDGKIRFRIGR